MSQNIKSSKGEFIMTTLSRVWTISYELVKVLRSIYASIPGHNKYRLGYTMPIFNLTVMGDCTSQKLLRSIESEVLGGNMATKIVSRRSLKNRDKYPKYIIYNITKETD